MGITEYCSELGQLGDGRHPQPSDDRQVGTARPEVLPRQGPPCQLEDAVMGGPDAGFEHRLP